MRLTTVHDSRRSAIATAYAALSWVAWLFALNLIWEVAQLPLYSMGRYAEWPLVGYAVRHCTFGDAAVAFVSYLLAAAVTSAPRWPLHRPLPGLLVVLAAGELFTIWAEWSSVYVLRNWAYAAGMPRVLGIGVAPLLQWLRLPPLALVIVRYRWRKSSGTNWLTQ